MKSILPVVILNARPAAGKSEIIAYLRSLGDSERRDHFHLGKIAEIDDFPMLWTWFEEDALLVQMGLDRIHTDDRGYFASHDLWNLLIRRICLEYDKMLRDSADLHSDTTVLIEFSRGSEHGGYREAYSHLTDQTLRAASVLYVDVSYEESLRKNQKRFNPEKPDSILEHGLPDEKLATLYRDTDWTEFSERDPHYITVGSNRLPYAAMDNADDVTSEGGQALADRLERTLYHLWKNQQQR
jgi:hypothetical protein